MDFIKFKKKILSSIYYKIAFISVDVDITNEIYISVFTGAPLPIIIVVGNDVNLETLINLLPPTAINMNVEYAIILDTIINLLDGVSIKTNVINELDIISNIEMLDTENFSSVVNEVLNVVIEMIIPIAIKVKPIALNEKLKVNPTVWAKFYQVIISSILESLNVNINMQVDEIIPFESESSYTLFITNIQMYALAIKELAVLILNEINLEANVEMLLGTYLKMILDNALLSNVNLKKIANKLLKTDMDITNQIIIKLNMLVKAILSIYDSEELFDMDDVILKDIEHTIV